MVRTKKLIKMKEDKIKISKSIKKIAKKIKW